MGTEGITEKTTTIAKLVSQAWKELSKEERNKWDEMARKDKLRYEVEKSLYTGPWKIPAKKRSQRDPNAPKRPMSAFLAYSHLKRAEVKANNADMNNAEISRVLAEMWKNAPEEEKKEHVDKEYGLRQKYLLEIAVWREKTEREITEQRKHREEMAMKTIEAGGSSKDLTLEGQQLAYRKDGKRTVESGGYGEYYQGSTAPQYYEGGLPPRAYGQDYQGYAPYYVPPGQYKKYDQATEGSQYSTADGFYSTHTGYYPAYYSGGYGGEYTPSAQSRDGAGFYNHPEYPPGLHDGYDQSRMTNDHYYHGHPLAHGDEDSLSGLKVPPAAPP